MHKTLKCRLYIVCVLEYALHYCTVGYSTVRYCGVLHNMVYYTEISGMLEILLGLFGLFFLEFLPELEFESIETGPVFRLPPVSSDFYAGGVR